MYVQNTFIVFFFHVLILRIMINFYINRNFSDKTNFNVFLSLNFMINIFDKTIKFI